MRRFETTVLVSLLVTLAACCLSLARADDTDAPPSALVPAYFYPAGPRLEAWRQLAENARTKNIEVILNPASGPGKKLDPAYVKVAGDLRKARGKILGYVSTNYAKAISPRSSKTSARTPASMKWTASSSTRCPVQRTSCSTT